MNTSKPNQSKKPMKARRMWTNACEHDDMLYLYPDKKEALFQSSPDDPHAGVPVAVIPLDDVEALIKKASVAISMERGYGWAYAPKFGQAASDVLTAIGVLPKRRKGHK